MSCKNGLKLDCKTFLRTKLHWMGDRMCQGWKFLRVTAKFKDRKLQNRFEEACFVMSVKRAIRTFCKTLQLTISSLVRQILHCMTVWMAIVVLIVNLALKKSRKPKLRKLYLVHTIKSPLKRSAFEESQSLVLRWQLRNRVSIWWLLISRRT